MADLLGDSFHAIVDDFQPIILEAKFLQRICVIIGCDVMIECGIDDTDAV